MAVVMTGGVHCPKCGKKLAERLKVSGESYVEFECPRCHEPWRISEVKAGAKPASTE